jgi:hypothetical protein
LHCRKLGSQVCRELIDYCTPPRLALLALNDQRADVPIECDQLCIDSAKRCVLAGANALLDVAEQRAIV